MMMKLLQSIFRAEDGEGFLLGRGVSDVLLTTK